MESSFPNKRSNFPSVLQITAVEAVERREKRERRKEKLNKDKNKDEDEDEAEDKTTALSVVKKQKPRGYC